jgi:hypothetical protein
VMSSTIMKRQMYYKPPVAQNPIALNLRGALLMQGPTQ